MKTLLVINSSARTERSITRHLTQRFTQCWLQACPDGKIIQRDVGCEAPPYVNASWIQAAFTPEDQRTPEMRARLAYSDAIIEELLAADAMVVGVPMYNFGMPAAMKAYIDQMIRANKTFRYLDNLENPYETLIPSRPLVLITASGTGGYEPGGPSAQYNFLDGHLQAAFAFVGLSNSTLIRVGFEERKDDLFARSLADAEAAVGRTALHIAKGEH